MRTAQIALLFLMVFFLTVSCKTVIYTAGTQTTKPIVPTEDLNMPTADQTTPERLTTRFFKKNNIAFLALSALFCMLLVLGYFTRRRRTWSSVDFTEMDLGLIRIIRDNAGYILDKHRKQSKVIKLDDWM